MYLQFLSRPIACFHKSFFLLFWFLSFWSRLSADVFICNYFFIFNSGYRGLNRLLEWVGLVDSDLSCKVILVSFSCAVSDISIFRSSYLYLFYSQDSSKETFSATYMVKTWLPGFCGSQQSVCKCSLNLPVFSVDSLCPLHRALLSSPLKRVNLQSSTRTGEGSCLVAQWLGEGLRL